MSMTKRAPDVHSQPPSQSTKRASTNSFAPIVGEDERNAYRVEFGCRCTVNGVITTEVQKCSCQMGSSEPHARRTKQCFCSCSCRTKATGDRISVRGALSYLSALKPAGPLSCCACVDRVCSADLHQASVNVGGPVCFFKQEFNHAPPPLMIFHDKSLFIKASRLQYMQ